MMNTKHNVIRCCKTMLIAGMLCLWLQSACGITLTVGLDPWPPFSGEELPNQGLSAEIIERVFVEAGYRAEIKIMPWSRVEASIKSGNIDVMGNLFYTDAIAQWADYSKPYYLSKIRFVALRERHLHWKTLQDLKPYVIGVGIGYSFGNAFDNAAFLNKHTVPLTLNGMQMLLRNRLDLVVESEDVVNYYLTHDMSAEANDLELLEPALATNSICIGVSRKNKHGAQIINDFNAAFSRLNADGTIKAIVAHYRSQSKAGH